MLGRQVEELLPIRQFVTQQALPRRRGVDHRSRRLVRQRRAGEFPDEHLLGFDHGTHLLGGCRAEWSAGQALKTLVKCLPVAQSFLGGHIRSLLQQRTPEQAIGRCHNVLDLRTRPRLQ